MPSEREIHFFKEFEKLKSSSRKEGDERRNEIFQQLINLPYKGGRLFALTEKSKELLKNNSNFVPTQWKQVKKTGLRWLNNVLKKSNIVLILFVSISNAGQICPFSI